MTSKDLTPTLYRHLRHSPFCEVCKKYIDKEADIDYIKQRAGRRVYYKFYHSRCLEKKVSEYEVI